MQEFIICLKEELLPLFSNVGLFILENWLARVKAKKKDNKAKIQGIESAMELVNLYIAEVSYVQAMIGTGRSVGET